MSKPCLIQPGTYKLLTDVKNPKPDRRQKYDWRAEAVWEAGTEFVVAHEGIGDGRGAHASIMLVGHKWASHRVTQYGTPEQFKAIVKSLVAIEESVNALFTRIGIDSNFVKWLVKQGKLSRAELEKSWNEYMNDESAP